MPPDALQTATTTPMISAVSEPDEDLPAAELMAWMKTPEACGGSVVARPCTS